MPSYVLPQNWTFFPQFSNVTMAWLQFSYFFLEQIINIMMEISLKLQRELWYITRPSRGSTLPWSNFSLFENVKRYLFSGSQLSTWMEESFLDWNWWNNQTTIYQIRYIEVARYLKYLIVKSKTTTLQVWKALFKTDFIVQKKKS